jgi:activator of 2-hydroxyglutaryl-CoA dehydratase
VIQNDKCADGLGIFYSTMARTLGISEQEMSGLALQSGGDGDLAIQCALSAQSDAIDLLCRGGDMSDVAGAVTKFIVERIADMCTTMALEKEVVAAGGLARSRLVVDLLSGAINRDVRALKHPEYAGAVGAAVSYEGEK